MGSAPAARLLRAFGDDPARVLAATRETLARVRGVGPALADGVAAAAGSREDAAREEARARDLGLSLLGPGDEGYPLPLLHAHDPPPLLYVWGAWLPDDAVSVAVVGARRATPYGVVQAARLARGLAGAGVTVVSGLARGVDGAAHRAALEAPGGRTLAVIGSGFARPYPAEHRGLLRDAAARGAGISEFPLDTPPLPLNFPRRNRVLAALALGTLVVEAAERSGALITAHHAMEAGRDVMALPGRVDSDLSRGAHRLLRDGAALVETWEDVLDTLGLPVPDPAGAGPAAVPGAEGGTRGVVLARLRGGDCLDADDLARLTGRDAAEVLAALAELEVDGLVRAFPGGRFARV